MTTPTKHADEIMQCWAGCVEDYRSWSHPLGPERVIIVGHDLLMSEPEQVLHQLADLLGVKRTTARSAGVLSSG